MNATRIKVQRRRKGEAYHYGSGGSTYFSILQATYGAAKVREVQKRRDSSRMLELTRQDHKNIQKFYDERVQKTSPWERMKD